MIQFDYVLRRVEIYASMKFMPFKILFLVPIQYRQRFFLWFGPGPLEYRDLVSNEHLVNIGRVLLSYQGYPNICKFASKETWLKRLYFNTLKRTLAWVIYVLAHLIGDRLIPERSLLWVDRGILHVGPTKSLTF